MSAYNHASIRASYVGSLLHPETFIKTIDALVAAAQIIQQHRPFQAIAFTGMSGAMIGPALAARLGVGMLLVRKKHDRSHSDYQVEGTIEAQSFLIVDDLVSSGRTIDRMLLSIEKWGYNYNRMNCVGVLEYASRECGNGTGTFTTSGGREIETFDMHHLQPDGWAHNREAALKLLKSQPSSYKLPPPKPRKSYDEIMAEIRLEDEMRRERDAEQAKRSTERVQLFVDDMLRLPRGYGRVDSSMLLFTDWDQPKAINELYKPLKAPKVNGIPYVARLHEATEKGSNGTMPQGMNQWWWALDNFSLRPFGKTDYFKSQFVQ